MKKIMYKIDTTRIVLDSDGRYELDDLQLMQVAGGKKKPDHSSRSTIEGANPPARSSATIASVDPFGNPGCGTVL